ncbi:MAG: hypothetical protein JW927_17935 [Deltaproteobacteria bacterium]|nr:hypothetical protein [Deltaproteobacteria bacterium]
MSKEVIDRKWGHYVMPIAYRYAAGAIGYAIETTESEWGEPIPPPNSLVVNEATGLPGKGIDYFIKNYLDISKSRKRFTKAERQSIVEAVHKEIYNYTGWRKLLQSYDLLRPPFLTGSSLRKKIEIRKYNFGGEAESDAHKRLKAYVCGHPELLELPEKISHSVQEYVLPSSDRIDVLFLHDDWFYAVEVKAANANNDDLRRGIFQCVKYRELLRAEQRTNGHIPRARAVLVTERSLPSNLVKEAKLLQVPFVKVNLKTT